MSIVQSFIREFEMESKATRAALSRIPEDKFDWRPHPKSFTLGRLVNHLAEIPGWIKSTLEDIELDLAPGEGQQYKTPQGTNVEQVLAAFDKNIKTATPLLATATEAQLAVPWSLKAGGHTIFKMPRADVLRGFIFNHTIHHRAQLGIYLRLNDISVPATYGPSADEGSLG